MSKPPLPEEAVTLLRKPNPAVITTLRPDGQPVATATWYVWDDGRILVNMDEGRKRLEHIRNDPRAWPISTAFPGTTRATRTPGVTAAGSAPGSSSTGGTAGAR